MVCVGVFAIVRVALLLFNAFVCLYCDLRCVVVWLGCCCFLGWFPRFVFVCVVCLCMCVSCVMCCVLLSGVFVLVICAVFVCACFFDYPVLCVSVVI